MKGKKKVVLFLKKKNQKNFCSLGDVSTSREKTNKRFLRSFFSKKRPLALFLFLASPALAQQTCVQVQVAGQKPNPFACLNQQLQNDALRAAGQSGPPTAPLAAGSPANAVGTFNETGVAEQYGKNFGVSAVPYRPAPPVFNSNLHE